MSTTTAVKTAELLNDKKTELFEAWIEAQYHHADLREDLVNKEEVRRQSQAFLDAFLRGIRSGNLEDLEASEYDEIKDLLVEISRARARQGFTPAETVTYILSLKDSLTQFLQVYYKNKPAVLVEQIKAMNRLVDRLAVLTFETYARSREDLIARQQREMMELSTPVIQVWDGVLCLPLIGTLDSERTQIVMQNLLQEIVNTESRVAILDISGVPAVDTLVAQHLLKTVSAARLMGAECIISGIRPEIAQTMVHLGIELTDMRTKSSMAEALREAFALLDVHIRRAATQA